MSKDESKEKIRPSAENIAIAEYYLGNPSLNIAIQQAGLQLGPIASHIIVSYHKMKQTVDNNNALGKEKQKPLERLFNSRQLDRYHAFKFFVEIRLPMLAAEVGPNLTDKLVEAYIATTENRVILAEGLKLSTTDFAIPTKKDNPAVSK